MNQQLDKAKKSAFRLLKFRLRSELELEQRLKKNGFTQDIINKALTFLKNLGYVDDLMFAKAWVNNRLELKPCSKRFLKYELTKKGVDAVVIHEVLLDINDQRESEIARKIAKKRLRQISSLSDEIITRRLTGYLIRRGYSLSLAMNIVKELVNNGK